VLPPPPSLTIVVASTGQRQRLLADLVWAAPYCIRDAVELVIARADTPAGLAQLTRAFPQARFIGAAPETGLPDLRSLGMAAARGDVVALLDHTDGRSISHEGWLHELRRCCSLHRSRLATAGLVAEVGAMLPNLYLSVVIPVHDGAGVLASSLAALAQSDLPRSRWELIVVDDASTDDSARVAARFADVVVRLPGKPHGTAYARNRGFEFARGECVAFINADVCVHPDTLTRFALVLAREPQVSAVCGSFDAGSAVGGLVSQYRNLRLKYYHQASASVAETFCASCGAVRSAAFAGVGMFDEWHFPRHQIEDFELGHRLRQQGHRIVMRPDIQATHLKRWTLRGMIAADFCDRAVPWMRLFDRRAITRARGKDRLRAVKTINTALTWLALALTVGAIRAGLPPLLAAAGMCLAVVLRNYLPQHRFFVRERGLAFALAVIPLELLSYLVNGAALVFGWLLREVVGEPKPPPTVEAFAEIGVRTWPPVPAQRADPVLRPAAATLGRPA
jgi:glycosyltransferase involved in cell wall biosynthesis